MMDGVRDTSKVRGMQEQNMTGQAVSRYFTAKRPKLVVFVFEWHMMSNGTI